MPSMKIHYQARHGGLRLRLWLLIGVALSALVCCTVASTRRLQALVSKERAQELNEGGSLLARADARVLKHLPRDHAGEEQLNLGTRQQQQAGGGGTATAGAAAGKGAAGGGAGGERGCTTKRHTDCYGEALSWGPDFRKNSAEECLAACRAHRPKPDQDNMDCNVWVFCEFEEQCGEHYRECWLKHTAQEPICDATAPSIGWTTGIMSRQEGTDSATDQGGQGAGEDRSYHVVISAQGTYTQWQSRIGYYWFKKVKAQCEAQGNCQMGGFTRILHSGQPDELMAEIPTFVAQELPPEHPNHGYVVLNRPYAFLQWIRQVNIPEKYVLMSEPDHIWIRPMPNLMTGSRPAAFPFHYIEPWTQTNRPIAAKFLGKQELSRVEAEKIAPIGNAPTLMTLEDLKRVVPTWFNLSIAVHEDDRARKEWDWVQEMYAFTLACTKAGISKVDLFPKMMSQPPFDRDLDPFYILHYTYGNDFDLEGNFTPGKFGAWRFDKRSYLQLPPPRSLAPPPAGMKNDQVRYLINAINEATSKIPGWDEYSRTGKATQTWDGVL